jgi:BirA family biotin operon repressor/biotin-[acetyl-CoA-carboxylase] ligase
MGGILVDLQAETHGHCRVVVGIGLNINTDSVEKTELNKPWISLKQIIRKPSDRNALVIALINQLSVGLAEYQAAGFSSFINDWDTRDHLRDKSIQIQWLNQTVTGVATGINSQGHLAMRLEDGTVKYFSSGEASLHRT